MADTIRPYSEIDYLAADRIATISLSRPDQLNAFTHVMRDELIDAFDRADSDDDVRAVVVTGRGRAFCAGADLSAGSDTFNADRRQRSGATAKTIDGMPRDGGGQVSLRVAASLKPVIAAINGPAVGVGRVFDAAEALRGGLVARTYPADELLPAAYALAREIADNTSAVAVATSRQLMWRMLGADSPWEAHRLDSRGIYVLGKAPDVAEGVSAFLEKRQPRFPMRISTDLPDLGPRWPEPPGDLT